VPTYAGFEQSQLIAGIAPVLLVDFSTQVGLNANNMQFAVDSSTWGTSTLRCQSSVNSNYLALPNGTYNYRQYEAFLLEYYVDGLRADTTVTLYNEENVAWTTGRLWTHTVNTAATAYGRQCILVRADQTTSTPGPYPGAYPGNSVSGWSAYGGGVGSRAATLANVRVQFGNAHQGPNPIWLKAIYGVARVRPKVVLYFDNWFGGTVPGTIDSHNTAIKPILDGYGWKCGVTIPISEIGNSINGPVSVLQTLQAEGHDVVCNDIVDRNMRDTVTDPSQARADMRATRAALRNFGLTRGVDIWVWNNNAYNKMLMDAAASVGITMGRAGQSERPVFQRHVGTPTAYEMLRIGSIGFDDRPLSDMTPQVEYAIRAGGDLHLYWHQFAPGGSSTTRPSVVNPGNYGSGLFTYTAAFSAFAAWLRARQLEGLIDVMSPSQYVNYLSAPQFI
jgi:hypothetical protein